MKNGGDRLNHVRGGRHVGTERRVGSPGGNNGWKVDVDRLGLKRALTRVLPVYRYSTHSQADNQEG